MGVTILLAVLAFCITIAVLGFLLDSRRIIRNKELRARRTQVTAATKALRSIANGAGNPTLEAQIALDTLDSIEYKELD